MNLHAQAVTCAVPERLGQRMPRQRAAGCRVDITCPNIDFAAMARSMGVPAVRVETPDQCAPAIAQALATDGPFLIDLALTNEIPNHFVYAKCGQ